MVVALRDGNIEKIWKRLGFLKNAGTLVWINEAFLCFYKAIELFIDPEYKKKYEENVKKKIIDDFSLLTKHADLTFRSRTLNRI